MVAVPEVTDDLRVLHDGLEAGLQSVMQGRHPRSARFSTTSGRVDGVVDATIAGPPTPLGVFSGARAARERDLVPTATALGGRPVGPAHAPGAVFWFEGSARERWRGAAALADRVRGSRSDVVHSADLRGAAVARNDGSGTGGIGFVAAVSAVPYEARSPTMIALLVWLAATAVPNITLQARRLHDTGRSGWAMLVQLVPVVGPFVLLAWNVEDSRRAGARFDRPVESRR